MEMDLAWINKWLDTLEEAGRAAGITGWTLFDPSARFYALLENGEDADLVAATAAVGAHLQLRRVPAVDYEWGPRMKPEVAGQIRFQGSHRSRIDIPVFYVGKPMALGAIWAHELTHEFLESIRLRCPDPSELEPVTDLASISTGLGKLVLNGTVNEVAAGAGEVQVLGYISPEVKVRAYRAVNERHAISRSEARHSLSAEAAQLVERCA